MPELTRVLSEEDLRARARTNQLDLSANMALLSTVREQQGAGGIVTLGEDEKQRTEKRRLSLAGKQQGYALTWRKADPGQLRFVLAEEGQPAPGSRTRRPQAEQQMESTGGEGVMTAEM